MAQETHERTRERVASGWIGLLGGLAIAAAGGWWLLRGAPLAGPLHAIGAVLAIGLGAIVLRGLFTLEPNQSAVLLFFGRYAGTVRREGFFWVNPLLARTKLSLRVRNFTTPLLKVNDASGNPIEIAAVIAWRVSDTAQASFDVDDYEKYTHIQSEMSLREVAGSHPYESSSPQEITLRGHFAEVSRRLAATIRGHVAVAGVEVDEARITHLAYAPEIAHVMLRRQQAEAVMHARERMVEGALGMISGALERMRSERIGELDPAQRGALVVNMMTVLLSETPAQPVIQLGDAQRPAREPLVERTALRA